MTPASTLQVACVLDHARNSNQGPLYAERVLAPRIDALKMHAANVAGAGSNPQVYYRENLYWLLHGGGLNRGAVLICETFPLLLPDPASVDSVLRPLLAKGVHVHIAGLNADLVTHLAVLNAAGLAWDRTAEMRRALDEARSVDQHSKNLIATVGSQVATDLVRRGLYTMLRQAVDAAFAPQNDIPTSAAVRGGTEGEDPVAQGPVSLPAV